MKPSPKLPRAPIALETPSSPAPTALLGRLYFRWLFGTRRQRGLAAQHEQELTAIDAGQRSARDTRKHLARVAIDVDDFGDGEPRRIRPVDARCQQPVADFNVGRWRREPKFRRSSGAVAEQDAANAAALDPDGHCMIALGDERPFR